MLETKNLSYISHKPLLKNISICFKPGSFYGILGPNGAGKTTLLKNLCGIWKPTKGSVLWNKKDLSLLSRKEISQIITLVPQSPVITFDYSVYEFVSMARYFSGTSAKENQGIIQQSLQTVNAWDLRKRSISKISTGERQRVYIARALATKAPVLLLDEPTSSLDIHHQLEILSLLQSLAKKDKIIIASLHNLLLAEQYFSHISLLNQGQLIGTGPYHEVLTPKRLKSIFRVEKHSNSKSNTFVLAKH